MALSFYHSFQTPVAILRPFNTYGPRQSARAVIPTIISQIAAGKEKILLGALSPTRDFSYVEDTAAGFIKAMLCDETNGTVTNIGSGFEISILDTAQLIATLMGKEVSFELDPTRIRPEKSEVERLFSSYEKAKNIMGWEPNYGGLEGFKKGLKKTIDWFTIPENLKNYKTDSYNI
jgi:dTDP-glucose 4,6-dehydratase